MTKNQVATYGLNFRQIWIKPVEKCVKVAHAFTGRHR